MARWAGSPALRGCAWRHNVARQERPNPRGDPYGHSGLLPVGFLVAWGLMMSSFVRGTGSVPSDYTLDVLFVCLVPFVMLLNILIYGMVAFYVVHIVRNSTGSDVVRILLALGIFFIPYLGMPAYYVIYILREKPPSWAVKPADVLAREKPDVASTAGFPP